MAVVSAACVEVFSVLNAQEPSARGRESVVQLRTFAAPVSFGVQFRLVVMLNFRGQFVGRCQRDTRKDGHRYMWPSSTSNTTRREGTDAPSQNRTMKIRTTGCASILD